MQIAIYISPYISRSKVNQAMKFGKLIKYNNNIFNRNIFLEISYTNYSPTLVSISLDK